jgi:hypothetical protein
VNTAHLAEWIRWTGVVIALLGVLIATPDGVTDIARRGRTAAGRMRGTLARLIPLLKRNHRPAGEFGGSIRLDSYGGTITLGRPWEPDADDSRKIEVLHQQVRLLLADVGKFKAEVGDRFTAVTSAIEQSETRLRAAHGKLAEAFEARDRRAAQVDARGLWPIGFGILLTGIPAELAYIHALGVAVITAAAAVTAWLGIDGIRSRKADRDAGS